MGEAVVFYGGVWCHLDMTHPEYDAYVETFVPDQKGLAILREHSTHARPKYIEENGFAHITFKIPVGSDQVTLRAFSDGSSLITARGRVIPMLQGLAYMAGEYEPSEILESIALLSAEAYEFACRELEDLAYESDSRESLEKIRTRANTLIRDASLMVQAYEDMHEAIGRKPLLSMRRALADLNSLYAGVKGSIGDLDSVDDRNMSRNLYVISVMSAIFLPLGFLTGLVGVNLDGVPYMHNAPYAFWVFTTMLVIFATSTAFYLKSKGVLR